MDLNKMAPDVRRKLLAYAMLAFEDLELDLDDPKIARVVEAAIHMFYIQFDSRLKIYNDADTLAQWDLAIESARNKTYRKIK